MSETSTPTRIRLPGRRTMLTETIRVGNGVYDASVGFDEVGSPKELFLAGAKDGTDMAAILDDTSVVVSVALQHGITARAMARSLSRVPIDLDGLEDKPASVIGAALDFLVRLEDEEWRCPTIT